jgi:hypothetical protein
VDSLSTDITLLTIGGDKTTCRAMNATIQQADGSVLKYGRFSWALATALADTEPRSEWIDILTGMRKAIRSQGWDQPLLFRGRPTDTFPLS